MKTLRYNLVDVFTDIPLTGNALAVFTSGKGLSSESMQSIARGMNLSETVFFFPPQNGGHAAIRIFTPRAEIPFAGHPVLGSAWVLGGPIEARQLRLETKAGIIEIDLERGGDRLLTGWMKQPLPEQVELSSEQIAAIHQALGFPAAYVPELPTSCYKNGPSHVIVQAPSVDVLSGLRPNFQALADTLPYGVSVFAFDRSGLDPYATDHLRVRYFAPAMGVFEDPATGSAAGPLGVHLWRHQLVRPGTQIVVRQGVEMERPSLLMVSIEVEPEAESAPPTLAALRAVRVGGAAVVMGRGEISVP